MAPLIVSFTHVYIKWMPETYCQHLSLSEESTTKDNLYMGPV